MLVAGNTLGPYRILAPLGAGGMGEASEKTTRRAAPGHLGLECSPNRRFHTRDGT
jgi:hypothetical protein